MLRGKKRLLLVYPKSHSTAFTGMKHVPYLLRKAGHMSATLPTVAALTPSNFEVRIIDENVEPIEHNTPYDLVGITGFPLEVGGARRIAEEFRKRGATIVCGGSGPTLAPERWRPFSDVLIRGEAERIWPRFVDDFVAGDFRAEYQETERFGLETSPLPDYSPLSAKARRSYICGIVQTSRGCPFNCEFCAVVAYSGRKMRYKPVDLVIREVEQLKGFGYKFIFLADDNFCADREEAKAILRALHSWNRRQASPVVFISQFSIDVAKDDEFLKLATEAGLNKVIVGIESPDVENLKDVSKFHNVKADMLRDVKRFHEYGIQVIGSTIVGFDRDDLSVFRQHFDFFMKAGIIDAHSYPLQAIDGTRLKQRVEEEGRYLAPAADSGRMESTVFSMFSVRPKLMSVDELRQGLFWLLWELYKPEHVAQRTEIFFEQFENSPVRSELNIPKPRVGWAEVTVFGRVLRYVFTRAPKPEREAFRRMFRSAQISAYPQARAVAVGRFLEMKNVHEMMTMLDPEIRAAVYPTRS